MPYPVRGQAHRAVRVTPDDDAELEIGRDGMKRPTSDDETSRRETPPAGADQSTPEELPEEFWSLISLEQIREAEPGEEEEYARRYLVLSRGHADLFPTLRRLLAGLEGIEIIVDRRDLKAPADLVAHRAEPVLVSPPGPPVIPEGESVEAEPLEALEPQAAEEAAPSSLQRYIIVSRSHADLAEILRRLQVTYRGIEVYVIVDRRGPEATPSEAEARTTKPELSPVPPKPSRLRAFLRRRSAEAPPPQQS